MENEPDLNFDVDALFAHMTGNLDHKIDDELEWSFSLRSADLGVLEKVANELEQEFAVHIQEVVEEIKVGGDTKIGPPMLSVIRRGALSSDDVKQIVARIEVIAAEHDLVYQGVSCYEPIDEEELFGWLSPEDACWRLRHMTDCGLADDEPIPWVFAVVVQDLDSLKVMESKLAAAGYGDMDAYDEPDEDGQFGICVFVEGRNNEFELNDCAHRMIALAEAHGGSLHGIQFYTREDLADVFGIGES